MMFPVFWGVRSGRGVEGLGVQASLNFLILSGKVVLCKDDQPSWQTWESKSKSAKKEAAEGTHASRFQARPVRLCMFAKGLLASLRTLSQCQETAVHRAPHSLQNSRPHGSFRASEYHQHPLPS